MCWPFVRKRFIDLLPIQVGATQLNHIDLLKTHGVELVTSMSAVQKLLKNNPALKLLPGALDHIRLIVDDGKLLKSLRPELAIVISYCNRFDDNLPLQAMASRTESIAGPNSFLIRLVVDSLQELFVACKQIVLQEATVAHLTRATGVDVQCNESDSTTMNRVLLGSHSLLFLHEFSHVVRNHLGIAFTQQVVGTRRLSMVEIRRVVEVDADFFACMLLAHFAVAFVPRLPDEKIASVERQYLWCLLISFTLFSAMSSQANSDEIDLNHRTRQYYSPLVRCHVIPIAIAAKLNLSIERADELLAQFYSSVGQTHAGSPILKNFSLWEAKYEQDLRNWRETECTRVELQNSGLFHEYLIE